MAAFGESYCSTKLHANIKDVPSRAGSSIAEVSGKILMFGGGNRNPEYYQDTVHYQCTANSRFERLNTSGDIPMQRNGHAVIAYGKYMFLHGGDGGTNDDEESEEPENVSFNDLYLFNSEKSEWGYVGESGVEPEVRNNHSLGIVGGTASEGADSKRYLVVYGGANGKGALSDTVFAEIPAEGSIGEDFAVEWKTLAHQPGPGPRESHGTCCSGGSMYVSGGKNEDGIRSDVWRLSVNTSSSSELNPLQWTRMWNLELPSLRCVHASCATASALYVFGGFTGREVSGELLSAAIPAESGVEGVVSTAAWSVISMNKPIEARIGSCMCAISPAMALQITSTSSVYSPLFRNQAIVQAGVADLVVFGGASVEKELGDIWLIHKN